jgi:hypothetical protein
MPFNQTAAIAVAGNGRASSSVTWFHTLIGLLMGAGMSLKGATS